VTKPYKFHFHVTGWQATLCSRPLSMVPRTTQDPARVNCTACLADPFLANRAPEDDVPPPKMRRKDATVVLDFSSWELAACFEDWMNGKDIESGWPCFGTWYDGKR